MDLDSIMPSEVRSDRRQKDKYYEISNMESKTKPNPKYSKLMNTENPWGLPRETERGEEAKGVKELKRYDLLDIK